MRIKWQWRFPLVLKRKRCLFTNYSRLNKSIHISGLHMEWRREGRQPAPYTFIHTCSVIITCSSWVGQPGGSDKYVLQFSFKILSAISTIGGCQLQHCVLVMSFGICSWYSGIFGIVILYFPVHFPPMTCTSLLVLVSCVVFVFNQSNDLTRFQFLSGSRTRLLCVSVGHRRRSKCPFGVFAILENKQST